MENRCGCRIVGTLLFGVLSCEMCVCRGENELFLQCFQTKTIKTTQKTQFAKKNFCGVCRGENELFLLCFQTNTTKTKKKHNLRKRIFAGFVAGKMNYFNFSSAFKQRLQKQQKNKNVQKKQMLGLSRGK